MHFLCIQYNNVCNIAPTPMSEASTFTVKGITRSGCWGMDAEEKESLNLWKAFSAAVVHMILFAPPFSREVRGEVMM